MFKKNSIIGFILGVLSYLAVSTVLEKFGVERDFIIEFIIISIILLSYLVKKVMKNKIVLVLVNRNLSYSKVIRSIKIKNNRNS